jgi:hypothetical protein
MTSSNLWGRVTGADKGQDVPVQQVEVLGRVGDCVIVSPYGLYADLPNDVLLTEVGEGKAASVTVKRPDDLARGEPAFFHPETNSRVIARNDGSLELLVGDNSIKISESGVDITGTLTINGDAYLDHGHAGSATAPDGPVSNTGVVVP